MSGVRALNELAAVIHAAQKQGRQTALGIAVAVDSAQMLMCPETAADLDQLRKRVAELTAELAHYERAEREAGADRADREADLAGALGYGAEMEWADLISVAAAATVSVSRSDQEIAELRKRVADLEAGLPTTQTALFTALDRVSELESAPVVAYRAEHPDSGITLGHYRTAAAARAHCEATERQTWPGSTLVFDWIEDEEDRVSELVVTAGQNEQSTTGYVVVELDLSSEYDAEADA